jgi:general secretion pathway protein E
MRQPPAPPATAGLLPYAFARDQAVALDGDRLHLGPSPTALGLRAARLLAGRPLAVARHDAEGFEAVLARLYADAGGPPADAAAESFDLETDGPAANARDLLEDPADAPVVRLVNGLLRQAVRAGASDLHLEPQEGGGLKARLRVDGTMTEVLDRRDVPARRVAARLKVMAGLDIAETRLPQDGRIGLRFGGRAIDLRLSTLPGAHGERLVMRLLDRTQGLMTLDRLGLSPAQSARLTALAAQPNGVILATGPTGSGKTTTLYSLLRLAERRERTILTIEDPVEYDLPGISQTQVNPDIGLTFAKGLRSILRQDPDVILVGEIRDGETAQVALEAALTGHLVFSSLHTNSALGALVRLRDLGVEPYLIAATLRGVLAQRLLRRVCKACAGTRPATAAEAARLGIATVPQARGCPDCDGTGYQGRLGVFDILEIGPALRAAIEAGAGVVALGAAAGGAGDGLAAAAWARVAEGETTPEEVVRVLGTSA